MTRPYARREYYCDVIAEGPTGTGIGGGASVAFVLATRSEISPRRALAWMCWQARRIADRLDPDPRSAPWARPVTAHGHSTRPDGPTRLRVWADAVERSTTVRDQLRTGAPLTLTVDDGGNGVFRLAIWPVTVRLGPEPEISTDPRERVSER
ncbi:hypothetical protein [Streptomyces sp. NPDC020965]|uniref:hypothetical protein n=1 Tax=Streptomyces sp. NPDC020965 TaxID=3365105 RepID=UPI0037A087C9